MLSCRRIVKILSSDEKISVFRRLELKLHLMMCEHCSTYSQQLKLMRKGFRSLFSQLMQVDRERVDKLETEVISKIKRTSGDR